MSQTKPILPSRITAISRPGGISRGEGSGFELPIRIVVLSEDVNLGGIHGRTKTAQPRCRSGEPERQQQPTQWCARGRNRQLGSPRWKARFNQEYEGARSADTHRTVAGNRGYGRSPDLKLFDLHGPCLKNSCTTRVCSGKAVSTGL